MLTSSLASLMGLSGAAAPTVEAPKWIYLIKRFSTFLANLELTSLQETDGWTKIHGVVSCLNSAYYGNNSETDHAFLIGSWAKGTRVRPPRDVDLYFVLPVEVYSRFEGYAAGTLGFRCWSPGRRNHEGLGPGVFRGCLCGKQR